MLQISGANDLELLNLLVPRAVYDDFRIPKHLSIRHLRLLKDLNNLNIIYISGSVSMRN